MKLAVSVVLALSCGVLAPLARADLRPTPPIFVRGFETPAEARRWVLASQAAMKSGEGERGKPLCDERGWAKNLVGGSGNTLESLFSQGARKGWRLVFDENASRPVGDGAGVILRTSVRDNATEKNLDQVWVLLVKVKVEGESRWLALGAGEKVADVEALGRRFLAGKPLAPPAE